MEMLVPWNDVFVVVAVGLWSMLLTAEVVNFFLKTGGQSGSMNSMRFNAKLLKPLSVEQTQVTKLENEWI